MHELTQPHPQEEDNPFKLPPDDQIFAIREKERQRRAEEREKVKQQHVWEKVCGAQLHPVDMRGNASGSVFALGLITSPVNLRTSASRISRTRRVDATGKYEFILSRCRPLSSSACDLRAAEDGIDDTQVTAEAARKARSDPRSEGLPMGGWSPRSGVSNSRSSTRCFSQAAMPAERRTRTSGAGFAFVWMRSASCDEAPGSCSSSQVEHDPAVESVSRRT